MRVLLHARTCDSSAWIFLSFSSITRCSRARACVRVCACVCVCLCVCVCVCVCLQPGVLAVLPLERAQLRLDLHSRSSPTHARTHAS